MLSKTTFIASLIFLFTLVNIALSVDPDLVGLWLFDEGKGNKVADSSGKGNDGEFKGTPKWVQGKFGKALEFDENDHLMIPDSDTLEFPKGVDFTLAVWIKTTAKPPSYPAIITKGYHDKSNTRPWYLLYYHPDGKLDLYLRNTANVNSRVYSKSAINDGNWHHIIAMKDKDKIKIFVDGNEEGSAKLAADTGYGVNNYPVVFMRHYERPLEGVLDEAAFFRRALKNEEIAQLMKGAKSWVLSVSPSDKLASTWGDIKAKY